MLARKNVRFLLLKLVLAAGFTLAWTEAAEAQVVAPRAAQGTYTVTYARRGTTTYLEERRGPDGSWTTVTSSSGGSGSVNYTFTSKPPGEYYYRTNSRILVVPRPPVYSFVASEETRILVTGPRPANADTFANQMQYDYVARQGDINYDGRLDLLIERTSGGTPNNGAVEKVILRRNPSGQFDPLVPTAAQAATASSWPVSSVQIEPTDLNLDGFADLQLSGLASSIGGADQIVVAAGNASGLPQRVVPMDAKYDKFLQHTQGWIANPDYIINNSQLIAQDLYEYRLTCEWVFRDDSGAWEEYVCDFRPFYVGTRYYYDASWVDPDSLYLRYAFTQVINGILQPIVIPGSAEGQTVDTRFFNVFGVQLMWGRFMDPNCDYAYDSIYRLTCIDWGKILLTMMAHLRRALDTDWRFLSAGEKLQAYTEGLDIENIDWVRVFNHAYQPWWETHVQSAGGDIYIGRTNVFGMPWSTDYSVDVGPNFLYLSIMVHELTHVFQVRTRGCGDVCIALERGQTGTEADYIYMPLHPNVGFYSYNLEQQAAMVQDRFQLRLALPAFYAGNRGVTRAALNEKIPFSGPFDQ